MTSLTGKVAIVTGAGGGLGGVCANPAAAIRVNVEASRLSGNFCMVHGIKWHQPRRISA